MLLWTMSNERNNHLFNNNKVKEWEIVQKALNYWEEFTDHHRQATVEKVEEIRTWKRPPPGWVKFNMDAAVLKEGGTGLGVVARD
ncbi:unnamed protein product [Linum trigynum]|uniref:RNase H type-1 domain-containing protein n=1 Tax=Linum trigynum TaxID=586398 RepID=A0AAV2CT50_9ROSI